MGQTLAAIAPVGEGWCREGQMFGSMAVCGRRRTAATLVVSLVLVAGCSGSAAPGSAGGAASTKAPAAVAGGGALGEAVVSGGDLCKLLGPGDFAAVGISGAAGPTENPTDARNNYCVYSGKSSATGGIEFDASVSNTDAEAHDLVAAMLGEFLSPDDATVTVTGADEARLSLPAAGVTEPAVISVRTGKLTFDIGIPAVDATRAGDQLEQLAALVVQRAVALKG